LVLRALDLRREIPGPADAVVATALNVLQKNVRAAPPVLRSASSIASS
jgi:hypothetical protein